MSALPVLPVSELKVGHFIVLTAPWAKHPFLLNRVLIKNQREIDRLTKAGIETVHVDPARSLVPLVGKAGEAEKLPEVPPPVEKPPLLDEQFRELIHDKSLPPSAKARAIYKGTFGIMDRLFGEPSPDRLQEFKGTMSEVVDVILADDSLSGQLLRITAHDFDTSTHSLNVGVLALLFARKRLTRSDEDMHEIAAGFFLHDIGKVRIDPGLINKRGRFSDSEREEMQGHVERGVLLIKESGVLGSEACRIIGQHHERFDGKGYPNGLVGDEIDPLAQICMLCDVYDALTSVRSYKSSMTPFEALKLIRSQVIDDAHESLFKSFIRVFD